jgi:hypothetical protein
MGPKGAGLGGPFAGFPGRAFPAAVELPNEKGPGRKQLACLVRMLANRDGASFGLPHLVSIDPTRREAASKVQGPGRRKDRPNWHCPGCQGRQSNCYSSLEYLEFERRHNSCHCLRLVR